MTPDARSSTEGEPAFRATGLAIYDNWRAALTERDIYLTEEIPLFSDARLTGSVRDPGLGPFAFLNAVPTDDALGYSRVAVVLRASQYLAPVEFSPGFDRGDDGYHGGGMADEVAALLSVATGARVRAGSSTRSFWPGADPMGSPHTPSRAYEPMLVTRHRRPVIPGVLGPHKLDQILAFDALPMVAPEDAAVLVQAARLYQEALWISDSEPHLAWLFLVSAVEVMANRWFRGESTPSDLLRAHKPPLAESLEAASPELFKAVAEAFGPPMKATSKFVKFSLGHRPPAPDARPPEVARVRWSRMGWEKVLNTVYECRSRALHAGVPFPLPMCEPPFQHADWDAPEERPSALGWQAGGASWRPEDVPVHLWVYARTVRFAIKEWWRGVASSRQDMT